MKAIIRGVKVVDYVKKTGEAVQGLTLFVTKKSADVIGEESTSIYLKSNTSFYYDVKKKLENDINELIGCQCFIDYDVTVRNGTTFSNLSDFELLDKGEK